MALVRAIEGNVRAALSGGWQCARCPVGAVDHPSKLDLAGVEWLPAVVPGTVASSLAATSAWSLLQHRDFDAEEWWYRLRVPADVPTDGRRVVLHLEGLATFADVWLDGAHLLGSESMFLGHHLDVTGRLRGGSELVIRFASLRERLSRRRPRPRWRTQVVADQQLRWIRTTLLGRIPGWAPPAAPVGPFRPVVLETQRDLHVAGADVRLLTRDHRSVACEATLRLQSLAGPIDRVRLRVGDAEVDLSCDRSPEGIVVARGAMSIAGAASWWPHTHGDSSLHRVEAHVRVGDRALRVDLGATGFRTTTLDRSDGGFAVRVNGVNVFIRGAIWTPTDVISLSDDPEVLRATLTAARDAGMNMLRVSGPMVYPPQAFHDVCDELGILVWQDFMFANMDYPGEDEGFAAAVQEEAAQVLDRLQLSPSLAVLCGNSEVQQQVAMLGMTQDQWQSRIFDDLLPAVARDVRPDVPYVPSTPTGGALPFRVDAGVSHYYGVGAYRRPLEDARRARVRFTSECLGFANVPGAETLEELGAESPSHPLWKTRVPRDRGTSWDFDDVRDHYLADLFGVDPTDLRTTDLVRYLELSRVVSGEVMAAAMTEWRRAGSDCRGALVWFLRDLWPGAGWGVIDAEGRPKAAYYFLRRVLRPIALLATDEGLNGLSLHAVNDTPADLKARVEIVLFRGEQPVAKGHAPIAVQAHGVVEIAADTLLGRFVDTTYAYRFGPPGHDLVVATLRDEGNGASLAQAFHLPGGRSVPRSDPGLTASAEPASAGDWLVVVQSARFAQSIAFDVRGYVPDDDFFHLEPGGRREIVLRPRKGVTARPSARLLPLNAIAPTKVALLATDQGR